MSHAYTCRAQCAWRIRCRLVRTACQNTNETFSDTRPRKSTNKAFAIQMPDNRKNTRYTYSRRSILCGTAVVCLVPLDGKASELSQKQVLEEVARSAYAARNFDQAVKALDQLLLIHPESIQYLEMRADTFVDGKRFPEALMDYDRVLSLVSMDDASSLLDRARILSGMALALEGLDRFDEAAEKYLEALKLANKAGAEEDPYILNSLGNCYSSLGKWRKARDFYLKSANGFQSARSDMGRAGGMQRRLDGSIFAFSNAALMAAQIGEDDKDVVKEMEYLARRAPGSADMRAALAVMYWSQEEYDKAETEWEFACNSIKVGCAKYEDIDWLSRVRRWPPVMVARMKDFLALRRDFTPERT